MVPSVLYSGDVDVAEWDSPAHSAVKEGGGAEAAELGGEGGAGSHLQGIQRLYSTPGYGELLPIPGEGDIGGG